MGVLQPPHVTSLTSKPQDGGSELFLTWIFLRFCNFIEHISLPVFGSGPQQWFIRYKFEDHEFIENGR